MTTSARHFAIALHGGCGRWPRARWSGATRGMRAAAQAGIAILERGGSALDAVCAAVVVLEGDPLFNAGTGAVLNRDGVAELDASVMAGETLACGGVAALRGVRNPVLVARRVMEDTPHVLLVAEGARAFARECGLAGTIRRASVPGGSSAGTVGAVALDARGRFAAATSTGGVAGKLPGRVGDSPIPGAGNYATRHAACSATGNGELMMRVLAAKSACDRVAGGRSAQAAVAGVVRGIPVGARQSAALIALDRDGRAGFAMKGGVMPRAWFLAGETDIHVAVA